MKALILMLVPLVTLGHKAPTIVDLSHPHDERYALNYPGAALPFRFQSQIGRTDDLGVWTASNNYESGEHTGTHIDAPYHFCKTGRTVDQIEPRKLITRGILVNASVETGGDWRYALPVSKLEEWEAENGEIPNNSVILVSFGWTPRYPDRRAVYGPSDDDLQFPGLSPEAASWIVAKKKVVGVGVDTPSGDISKTVKREVHVTLTCNDIYILENVAIPPGLPPKFDLFVMPIKFVNGTGAPTRVMATFKSN